MFKEYVKAKEDREKTYTVEEFKKFQEKFYEMQNVAFEMAFRIEDNDRQEKKVCNEERLFYD